MSAGRQSENCYCGGPEDIYPHRRGTGYYCREQDHRGGDAVRRDSDTDEIEAMTCAVHQLICVPLIAPAWHHYGQHRGPDPDDDVACRSRARFLVESLHIGGWRVTEIAPAGDTGSGSAHTKGGEELEWDRKNGSR